MCVHHWRRYPVVIVRLTSRLSFRGADVVDVLERVCREMGFPATIRVDQGTEFVSRYLDLWAYQRSVTLDFSRASNVRNSAWIAIADDPFVASERLQEPTGAFVGTEIVRLDWRRGVPDCAG